MKSTLKYFMDAYVEYCYDNICEASLLKYDSKKMGIDDVIETNEVLDEI